MSPILSSDQVHTLVARAIRDSALRQALLDDPHAVVHTQLGLEIPAGKTLRVLQAQGQTVTVVIPPRPADGPDNLSVEAAATQSMGEAAPTEGKVQRIAEARGKLIARAWQDEAFKQHLLQNPKDAVRQELSVSLPDDLTLQVVIDDEDHQHLLLPLEVDGSELSDEQLEGVAGGEVAFLVTASVVVTAGLSLYAGAHTNW